IDAFDGQMEIGERGEPALREQRVVLAAVTDEVDVLVLEMRVVGQEGGGVRQSARVEVIVVGANQFFVRHPRGADILSHSVRGRYRPARKSRYSFRASAMIATASFGPRK